MDCFEMYNQYGKQVLPYLIDYLFGVYNLNLTLGISYRTLNNLLIKVSQGYKDNPYHNVIHAFDVTIVK